jgi:hypothetical protein
MLIERSSLPPTIDDIVTVKLLSGEEIIGKLTHQQGDSITLAKPIQIRMHQVGPNQIGMAFAPVFGSAAETSSIVIPTTSIAVKPVKTDKNYANDYIEATTSLVTAPSNLVL